MVWYTNPALWSIISSLSAFAIIGLMMSYRKLDTIHAKKKEYENHIKDLVNRIYDKATNKGTNLANTDFYGIINDFRPTILEHFSTYKKELGVDLSEVFFSIAKARSNNDINKEMELKKQLTDKFQEIHEKVNHSIDPNFGYCLECIGKKTIFPFFHRHKLKKIRT